MSMDVREILDYLESVYIELRKQSLCYKFSNPRHKRYFVMGLFGCDGCIRDSSVVKRLGYRRRNANVAPFVRLPGNVSDLTVNFSLSNGHSVHRLWN